MIDLHGLLKKNPDKCNELNYQRLRVKHRDIVSRENEKDIDSAHCDICLKGYCQVFEDGSNDDLIMCDCCKVLVHQSCYERDLLGELPEGDWLCERCIHLLYKGRKRKCVFCNDSSGAIIQFNVPKPANKRIKIKSPAWAHICCSNWIGGVQIEGENLEFESELEPLKQWCHVCQKQGEYLINCEHEECEKTWHVRCAIKIGIIEVQKDEEEEEGTDMGEESMDSGEETSATCGEEAEDKVLIDKDKKKSKEEGENNSQDKNEDKIKEESSSISHDKEEDQDKEDNQSISQSQSKEQNKVDSEITSENQEEEDEFPILCFEHNPKKQIPPDTTASNTENSLSILSRLDERI